MVPWEILPVFLGLSMSILATCRAANPMHVVIDGAHIKDDDMGDAGNVNAASDDILVANGLGGDCGTRR